MNVKDQLKTLLQDNKLGAILRSHWHNFSGKITDVCNGFAYKNYGGGKLLKFPHAISLLMSTDGVPVFKSSKVSMWPVSISINELPPNLRRKYMMACVLWVGEGKPNFSLMLRDFVNEMKYLSINGFQWTLNNEIITSTVVLTNVCVDSVARAPLQNLLQFNGYFGCAWCENPGVHFNNTHVYEYNSFPLRTKESVAHHASRADEYGYPVMGVKGLSILSELPLFDIVNGFVTDSMHGVDMGVVKQLVGLWLDSKYSESEWYIGLEVQRLNAKLAIIIPPSSITRLTLDFNQRPNMKSSEWRNVLLCYGSFIFKDILPTRYYEHFMLLSEAIYILSGTDLTPSDIYEARIKLNEFVGSFQSLYGLANMSFNVHQLLHVANCVCNWGPLWGYSAYTFEDFYGKLLQMFNGTQKVSNQIVQNFQHLQLMRILTNVLSEKNILDFLKIQNQLLATN